ncbi:MAG: hypothetical protein CL820_16935 [Croceicoccus sp.]|uniref:Uncharacterized protein n=1 Tax=Croceicoccus marinus TaxID=450378 RepID=A0A7G6W135_9SPHN|nr:hypothetical protein [Croceicoccus marinus]MAF29772.1 hypothetical protein [Croceicoccus sp.]MAL27537.1 hypothetical protein [Croceicoccus sp.]QNE07700.1 hypothetical protein H4O24_19375 [Croceicoccus marinus]
MVECNAVIALLRMISGIVLWAAAFSTLYALHGLNCSFDSTGEGPFGLVTGRALLLATWASLLVAHAFLVAWLLRRHSTLLDRIGIALGWIGLGATIITGVPILMISICI